MTYKAEKQAHWFDCFILKHSLLLSFLLIGTLRHSRSRSLSHLSNHYGRAGYTPLPFGSFTAHKMTTAGSSALNLALGGNLKPLD